MGPGLSQRGQRSVSLMSGLSFPRPLPSLSPVSQPQGFLLTIPKTSLATPWATGSAMAPAWRGAAGGDGSSAAPVVRDPSGANRPELTPRLTCVTWGKLLNLSGHLLPRLGRTSSEPGQFQLALLAQLGPVLGSSLYYLMKSLLLTMQFSRCTTASARAAPQLSTYLSDHPSQDISPPQTPASYNLRVRQCQAATEAPGPPLGEVATVLGFAFHVFTFERKYRLL